MKTTKSMKQFFSTLVLPFCLLSASSALAFDVQVSEAPTTDLALTVGAIQSAKKTLLINIYEMSSPDIADAILNRIQAGVHVEMIQEGQIVGGLSAAGKGIQAQIAQAMQSAGNGDRLLEMSSKGSGGKRRFRFDHAKYVVIDGQALLIGSENYSPTGNPTPGSVGNRGWEVLVFNPAIAQEYAAVFQADSDVSQGDLIDLTQGAGQVLLADFSTSTVGGLNPRPRPAQKPAPATPAPRPAPTDGIPAAPVRGGSLLNADSVERITSPDLSKDGLLALVNGAQKTLDIEQMTFDSEWGTGGGQNPLTDAVIAAIKRGVKVRVLLNDEAVFNHGKPARAKNQPTVDLVNQNGGQATIANLKAMGVDYIHNKGVLVDGNKTLISSINWNENSIEKNREAAIVLTSSEINAHYQALFDHDWEVSFSNRGNISAGVSTVAFSDTASGAAVAATTLKCPSELRVEATIGELVAKNPDDGDFTVLSGKTINEVFVRSIKSEGCVLTNSPRGGETKSKMFVQLHTLASGMISFSLEGYTPKTRKVYTVRSKFDPETSNGDLDCMVYNGRESVGRAQVHFDLGFTH